MSRRRQKARPCPTATKHAYPDRIAAELDMHRIVAAHETTREQLPVRAYRCECARWHLTHKPIRGGVGRD